VIAVPLGKLITAAPAERAGDREIDVLSMTMHEGLVLQSERFKKRIAGRDLTSYKIVRPGQLVVSFPIDEGVLDFWEGSSAGIVSPAYKVWNLRSESQTSRDYLKRYLRSPRALHYYREKMRGSTARRRSLPLEDFVEMPIPLPALEEQRRIVAVLDKADALRAKRRQVLGGFQTLVSSLYAEFFETPATTARPLSELAEKVVVGHVGPTAEYFREYGVPFLRTGNVGNGSLIRAGIAYVTEEFHERLRKSQLRTGDVLVSRVITDQVRASILPPDLDGSNCANIIVVRPSDRILASTILGFLALPSTQRQLLGRKVGSAQGVVNTGVLKALSVPDYPVEAQRQLLDRITRVDGLTREAEKSARHADQLFDALQSRAFRGDL
jgi:type I restriction enzyme S subunit